MSESLESAFFSYVKLVEANTEKLPRLKTSLLYPNKSSAMKELAATLEATKEFRKLVEQTKATFQDRHADQIQNAWEYAIAAFFRRSGYYLDIFEGSAFNVKEAFQKYRDAFLREQMKIRYLAPLEYVQFHGESMDFSGFSLRRLKGKSLEEIFQNRINRVFYPWANVSLSLLPSYWFIDVTDVLPTEQIGSLRIRIDPDLWAALDRASITYSTLPKALDNAFLQMALFDWGEDPYEDDDLRKTWRKFGIPFVLRVSDYLLSPPYLTPSINLHTEPVVVDQETGAVEEIPFFDIDLDEPDTAKFRDFIRSLEPVMTNLEGISHDWPFINLAIGNLKKAFLTPENLEQLLWHITALDALFGENVPGITRRLGDRIAQALGRSQEEKKRLRKQFNELYKFRSLLVHGSSIENQVYKGHLRMARDLARRSMLWFLHCLRAIRSSMTAEAQTPARDDVLTLLDMDRKGRERLGNLIKVVPSEFPQVSGWLH